MISLVSVALLAMSLISSSATVPTSSWWQPAAGTTWQCVLDQPVGSLTLPVQVYDFDLFDTPQSSIDTLHAAGKQVICYFSGGTYEPSRPDSDTILSDSAAVGAALDGWPDEKWLDIRTDFIVNIMKARIDTAASKGCDGVDPDNGKNSPLSISPAQVLLYSSLEYLESLLTRRKSMATKTAAAVSPRTSHRPTLSPT
jgi:hypothetical protein